MNGFNQFFPVDHPDSLPPDAHLISGATAAGWIKNDLDPRDPFRCVLFHGGAHPILMKQDGAVGYAVFPCHNGHHNTIVIVATNANGRLLLGPGYIALENGQRCPPLCPEQAAP